MDAGSLSSYAFDTLPRSTVPQYSLYPECLYTVYRKLCSLKEAPGTAAYVRAASAAIDLLMQGEIHPPTRSQALLLCPRDERGMKAFDVVRERINEQEELRKIRELFGRSK